MLRSAWTKISPIVAWVRARLRRTSRDFRAGAVLLILTGAIYANTYARMLSINIHPHGDGYFSWIYARSLVFDHDVDFANDYKLCVNRGDFHVVKKTGKTANAYYAGPALIWTPILYVLRSIVHLPADAPPDVAGACKGPLTMLMGWISISFNLITTWLTYRAARRFRGVYASLGGALVCALGSSLLYYGTTLWFYSHMWSALGVSIAFVAWLRAREAPERTLRWFLVGLAIGFAALMRPQEVLWALLPLSSILTLARAARVDRTKRRPLALTAIATALGFASIYWVQIVVYEKIYGVPWLVPQGKLYVQPWHSHPLLMLFSGTTGFFSWTPLMWLGVIGLVALVRKKDTRSVFVPVVIVLALEVWTASSALAWGGAASFGARMLTGIVPIMGVAAAAGLESLRALVFKKVWRAKAFFVAVIIAPLAYTTAGLMFASSTAYPHYGEGFDKSLAAARKAIGNPFTLPATAVFAARYRVEPVRFDDVAVPGMFLHGFRDAVPLGFDTIVFATPPTEAFVPLTPSRFGENGLVFGPASESRFLVTLYWPWVTGVKLTVKSEKEGTMLTIDACGFFRCREALVKTLAAGVQTIDAVVPEGVFDSGINEVRVRADGVGSIADWTWKDDVKRDPAIPDPP